MSEATLIRGRHDRRLVAAAAITANEIYQLPDGRAAVKKGANAAAAGDTVAFTTEGQFTVPKTASQVWIDGGPIWWDHSANTATCIPPMAAGDRDFFLGAAIGDAANADSSGAVNLNVRPVYEIDLQRDEFDTVVVKTVVGSTTVEIPDVKVRGGTNLLILGTTAEAQKVDLLSKRSFAKGAKWIVEGIVNIITNSDNAAGDFNIGVANGTHATDADSITEACFLHTDGNALDISAASRDGTTTVAITDTTTDFAVGTPFHFAIDGRNLADIQIYINGVLQLGSTVFKLDAATGPLRLLAHLEKTSDDSPGTYGIVALRMRYMEQDTAGN